MLMMLARWALCLLCCGFIQTPIGELPGLESEIKESRSPPSELKSGFAWAQHPALADLSGSSLVWLRSVSCTVALCPTVGVVHALPVLTCWRP